MRVRVSAVLLVALALVSCQANQVLSGVFGGTAGRWIDLTYPFSAETIYWPTGEPFRLERVAYGRADAGYFYSSNNFSAAEHGGTHFDAPIHFAERGQTAELVPVDRLIGPAVVVDVTDRATPDYQVQVDDLERWEATHGPIPGGVVVLLRTGWGSRWPNRLEFLGTDLTGAEAVPNLHFPGLSAAAARWLVDNRSVDAVGIDTPSIDYGQSSTFETHVILCGAGMPIFENIANLGQLPEAGSYVVALPIKSAGGSGGPLRIVGFVPS